MALNSQYSLTDIKQAVYLHQCTLECSQMEKKWYLFIQKTVKRLRSTHYSTSNVFSVLVVSSV